MSQANVEWSAVTKFVRQISHDLRNHLNALELQAALLNEIVSDQEEAKSEIKRLREISGEMAAHLQRLTQRMAEPQLTRMSYRSDEFFEDLRAKVTSTFPEQSSAIEWQSSLGADELAIDPQLLLEGFLELFRNAFTHARGDGALRFSAKAAANAIEFELREPKRNFACATENWGAQPLGHLTHGHYGLGLFRARSIFAAHGGELRAKFDPATATLVTNVSLPRAET